MPIGFLAFSWIFLPIRNKVLGPIVSAITLRAFRKFCKLYHSPGWGLFIWLFAKIFKDFSLQIFDQFGQVIYYVPNNYNNEFDGTYKGNALPTGNYYFVFKNDKKTFKGNIAIVN